MASAAKLYTPEILGLATSLATFPWDDELPLQGGARSQSCGSAISLAIGLDAEGRIDRVGVRSQACAIGQAAAAVFAKAAAGRDRADIAAVERQMIAWLAGEGAQPDWPGIEALAPARDYPGRHGAMLLAWRAAREMLSAPQ